MTSALNRLKGLPRIYQCNLDRFFQRVVAPLIGQLPVHARLETGEAKSYDEFLDRCGAQVDNHLANEAAKAFALTLSGAFERQLHDFVLALWETGKATPPSTKTDKPDAWPSLKYEQLLTISADYAGIDLEAANLSRPLAELLLVGNVVRHGEGGSCRRLSKASPRLWEDPDGQLIDLSPGPTRLSDRMRIQPADLYDFAVAAMNFWGRADTDLGAVTVIPGYPPLRDLPGPAVGVAKPVV